MIDGLDGNDECPSSPNPFSQGDKGDKRGRDLGLGSSSPLPLGEGLGVRGKGGGLKSKILSHQHLLHFSLESADLGENYGSLD